MKPFFESHNSLIADLSKMMEKERNELRKLHCEGHIYGLYVHLLNNLSSLTYIDIVVALQEIETLERLIMMDHYCYSTEDFHIDYRGEYPCRTSAIIIDILSKNMERYIGNSGCCYVINSIIKNRLSLLDGGVYPEYFSKGKKLLKNIRKMQ